MHINLVRHCGGHVNFTYVILAFHSIQVFCLESATVQQFELHVTVIVSRLGTLTGVGKSGRRRFLPAHPRFVPPQETVVIITSCQVINGLDVNDQ